MNNYQADKHIGYLHNKPSRSAENHTNHCLENLLDDRVSCGTCAGYVEKESSKVRLDDKTRERIGYELVKSGLCRWIYGTMDPERLHRCNSFQPQTAHAERMRELKQATGRRGGA